MKVFRKELFFRENQNYTPVFECENPWWEVCDGIEVYPDDELPNMYNSKEDGSEFVFLEKWCEEIEYMEILLEMCDIICDVNVEEITLHIRHNNLENWCRAWRKEAERIVDTLATRELKANNGVMKNEQKSNKGF